MRGWHQIRHMFPSSLPERAAVYAIFGMRRVVYIGQTNNLRRRFRWHSGKWNAARMVKCCHVDDADARLLLERRLIARLRPEYNVQHTGLYRVRASRWW